MLYIVGKDTYSHDRQRILPQQELEMDMVSLIVLILSATFTKVIKLSKDIFVRLSIYNFLEKFEEVRAITHRDVSVQRIWHQP